MLLVVFRMVNKLYNQQIKVIHADDLVLVSMIREKSYVLLFSCRRGAVEEFVHQKLS